ncbi:hypothetical protein [Halomontanus rarus]|uniref:hypothetical protein n=1 Tax=Halomontanus rarus TaxID=3034020 RepID=UPI0023E7E2CA|nr:hypothetical protein [Halovivax sp. TS33]
MDETTSERAPRFDVGEAVASTIRDHRWPSYILVIEVFLGLLAATLQTIATNSGTSGDHQYEILAGMIGGWMVVILVVAVVVFLIMTALNALDDADDHYLDYVETSK